MVLPIFELFTISSPSALSFSLHSLYLSVLSSYQMPLNMESPNICTLRIASSFPGPLYRA